MLTICTLSHGNADPKRGFSINKYLLVVHGGSTSEKTIQVVRFVKDFISLKGGEKNVKVSKPMLTECLLSCWREMREKEDEAKQKAELKRKCEKEGQKEEKQITHDIETICLRIKVADELLKSGQAQLED